MQLFEEQKDVLFKQLGEAKKMVLSTSLYDKVTSRIMSVIIADSKLYFQTDITFRKYEQLQKNPNVSLCADNAQIEGLCTEIGHPSAVPDFCRLYEKNFFTAYKRYTLLESERVFEVKPMYIQKWIYENDLPFVERYDFCKMVYSKEQYVGAD